MNDYIYPAELLRVIDGDTIVLRLIRAVKIDFGFRMTASMQLSFEGTFRMVGINAPELHSKNKKEVKKAVEAKEAMAKLLASGTLLAESFKPHTEIEADKYGRWLVKVKVTQPDGKEVDAGDWMLHAGFVVFYDGKGARPPFEP